MLEFATNYEFDNIALIQATSPMLTSKDLDNAFEIFSEEGTDSVLSAVKQKRFNWTVNKEGYAEATNYDVYHRPRRQEFDGYFVENGAFYITSRERLINTKNRLSGNIKIAAMSEETFYEIDEQDDWDIVENLMKLRDNGIIRVLDMPRRVNYVRETES
jgi:N-acylneuraminate cytidylyltransferase